MSNRASELSSAWQSALAAEHEAFFAYGLLGPRLVGGQLTLAQRCYAEHEQTRDSTQSAIAAAGLTPVPPEADYPALYPVNDATAARRLAIRVEDICADAWRYLYSAAAATTGSRATSLRTGAQAGLTESAVRACVWRVMVDPDHATEPFPGI